MIIPPFSFNIQTFYLPPTTFFLPHWCALDPDRGSGTGKEQGNKGERNAPSIHAQSHRIRTRTVMRGERLRSRRGGNKMLPSFFFFRCPCSSKRSNTGIEPRRANSRMLLSSLLSHVILSGRTHLLFSFLISFLFCYFFPHDSFTLVSRLSHSALYNFLLLYVS